MFDEIIETKKFIETFYNILKIKICERSFKEAVFKIINNDKRIQSFEKYYDTL